MNYKKGLARIFVIGLIIAPIAGFFSVDEESRSISKNIRDISYEMSKEIQQEPCVSIVKSNPRKFPELQSAKSCYWTFVYWDTIREWQDKNGKTGQIIDEDAVKQTMAAEAESAISEVRWTQAGYYTFSYLFLWIVSIAIFFIGKWIYKGFQSK
jgi:hypothetical protein